MGGNDEDETMSNLLFDDNEIPPANLMHEEEDVIEVPTKISDLT
jgi:hypothetical protein